MPLPKLMAKINKRTFNKRELKRGVRPVLTHVGRSSGKTYRTPLDAYPVEGGYMFILMYGADSDWVQNVMAAGKAELNVGDDALELDSPRVVTTEEAIGQMAEGAKPPPSFMNITEYLQMNLVADRAA